MGRAGPVLLAAMAMAACAGSDGPAAVGDGARVLGPPADAGGVLPTEGPGRGVVSLNGTWEAAQGRLGSEPPATFDRTAPVPSLLSSATPPFADVGLPSAEREAFWYRRTFVAPPGPRAVAQLTFHKAKYGLAVWLNGVALGERVGVFSRADFDVASSVLWGAENTVVVRVGATREALAADVPTGEDVEKDRWLPGLYDDVVLAVSGTPHIERVRVSGLDQAAVRTWIRNAGEAPVEALVISAAGGVDVASAVVVPPGETVAVDQTLAIPEPHHWSPEDPHLYTLATRIAVGGQVVDDLETRFGLRTVEWRRDGFYLNGQRRILRGSNITLHRFFEDPAVGTLPWDEAWVRRLLGTHPKALGWDTFRITIGRAPRLWYRVADELGLLLADEYMIWNLLSPASAGWSEDRMVAELTSWVQESWNHPSIAWWDVANETADPRLAGVVDRVRPLDPSRAWESGGFNPPNQPGDPIEDHPYLFSNLAATNDLAVVAQNDGQPPQGGIPNTSVLTFDAPDHPYILNEYGWVWLNRDGTPTALSAPVFDDLLGPGPHAPEVLREAAAYVVGGLTEHWRAHRGYAAVLHFTYLGYSRVGGETSDNFLDPAGLTLEPRFLHYAAHAFAPVGVYLQTWAPDLPPGEERTFPVVVWNDTAVVQPVTLRLVAVTDDGTVVAQGTKHTVTLAPLGAEPLQETLLLPVLSHYLLVAEIRMPGGEVVVSRRKIGYAHPGERGPDPPYGVSVPRR